MLHFAFGQTECQDINTIINKEWLETNGLGDYASSSIPCCNTRKYHGLLVTNLHEPEGKYVLLSTAAETLQFNNNSYEISCRKHPEVFYPQGWQFLQRMTTTPCSTFTFLCGDTTLERSILMPFQQRTTLIKYSIKISAANVSLSTATLKITPLLAYRNFHDLTHANLNLQVKPYPARNGCMLRPYNSLPPLFLTIEGQFAFFPSPDWCYRVEYPVEMKRGFPYQEDLFQPGLFELSLNTNSCVYFAASTEEITEPLSSIWNTEIDRRNKKTASTHAIFPTPRFLQAHLAETGETFLVESPASKLEVTAGYHWFGTWGRDTLISLPGLTFCAGRQEQGMRILQSITESIQNGLIPNIFSGSTKENAFNSADASLWLAWTMQQMLIWGKRKNTFLRKTCWPALKNIVDAFLCGAAPNITIDETSMLHIGTEHTQLTWMDAAVDGKPVTARAGCPVEIAALWYNTLAFADFLASQYKEKNRNYTERLENLRKSFIERFWIGDDNNGYLADVWNNGVIDKRIRPNQIFAASMPFSMLDQRRQSAVIRNVKNFLLTPYGLRTLAPDDDGFCPTYDGNAAQRDAAYHQGTVWPWLLGAYADALVQSSSTLEQDAAELLQMLTPLFTRHLADAGIGFISEIFSATSPYAPDGCIAQAWSIAECFRLLLVIQQAAPSVYHQWESSLMEKT